MRIALKIAYDGTKFHGFAIQPNLRTIEGEITNHLRKISKPQNKKNVKIQSASRTDRGVSANENVIVFDSTTPLKETIFPLQAELTDIWIRGIAQVSNEFNPRYAKKRWYRYYLPKKSLDTKKTKQAAQIFLGLWFIPEQSIHTVLYLFPDLFRSVFFSDLKSIG